MSDGIPSPSPEFPQQIKNVTGNANVKIQNKNLFDKNNANVIEGYVTSTTQATILSNGSTNKGIWLKVKPNTTYTISRENSSTNVRLGVASTVLQPAIGVAITNVAFNNNTTPLTITTGANDNYLFVYLWTASSSLTIEQTLNTVQIEQGSTATSYVEHQEQNYPFSLKSKNLFDKTTLNVNKGLLADGTLSNNTALSVSDYIPVLANTDYFLSNVIGLNLGRTCAYYDENKAFISIQTFSGVEIVNAKITTPNNTKYMRIAIKNGNENIVQIEKGSTATDYEPYYDIRAMEGTTLEDDGVHNKKKQIILNGTENWQLSGNTSNNQYILGVPDMKIIGENVASTTLFCNYLKSISGTDGYRNNNINGISSWSLAQIRISLDVSIINRNVIQFKAWLAQQYANGTPVIVEYELATEEIIPYNETQQAQYNAIKQARSYDDQTNISQKNDNLPFILDIEALKGETTNEVNLLTRNNRKTAEYLESSLVPEEETPVNAEENNTKDVKTNIESEAE